MFTKLSSFGFSYNKAGVTVLDYTLLSRFTTLYIDCTNNETEQFLARVAQHCPNLQHFCFQWWNEDLEGGNFDVLLTSCPHLRTLSAESEVAVEKHLPRWRSLRADVVVNQIDFVFYAELSAFRKVENIWDDVY